MSEIEKAACQIIPVRGLNAEQLVEISQQRTLALSAEEMQAIQAWFRKLERDPTDVELECLAQTWSEHCKHKVFSATIHYEDNEGRQTIKGIFPSFIRKATEDIRQALGGKDFCASVFKDNAGVIHFKDDWCVAFKVETHNHPSALDPYGGAATGIGGVIRDVLGTGLGAKPIANTDVFCVAPPDTPFQDLPPGMLHPRRILKGVVEGVRDYGNRMGIATVNGSVNFSPKFLGNPLVFCGTAGLIPLDRVEKQCRPGDLLISIGGKTGRDGLHGATFSSQDLHEESAEMSGGAVQIGNPVVEKRVEEALLQATREGLLTDCTDCGAGGFSSAIGEMCEKTGGEVILDNAPLKYAGLDAWEIFLSEAQERMVVAIAPESLDRLKEICRQEAVEWANVGVVTDTGRLVVKYRDETVCDLDTDFLHNGLPGLTLEARFEPRRFDEPGVEPSRDLNNDLLDVLGSWDVCSKEWIIRQYDHEVQGGSVTKPLQGAGEGPGDGAVWNPLIGQEASVVISHGINVRYGEIDPYWMAAACIDEALRGIVASGGNMDRIAILDNFCMGSPMNPGILGDLVRMGRACYDFATAYGTPFISGKDSFYNQFQQSGETIAIPPTLLVSAIGILEDLRFACTSELKQPGSTLFILGQTKDELGGSCYHQVLGGVGNKVPRTEAARNLRVMKSLAAAHREGLVKAMHDLSDGGLGVALAEMVFSGEAGLEADISGVPGGEQLKAHEVLFSESTGRFAVEVAAGKEDAFRRHFEGLPAADVGKVNGGGRLTVSFGGKSLIDCDADTLRQAWRKPFRNW
jgi:phosphoribosylformylglycinamidine synthase